MPRVYHRPESPFGHYSSSRILDPWPRGTARLVDDNEATYLTSVLAPWFIPEPDAALLELAPEPLPTAGPTQPGKPISKGDTGQADKDAEMSTPPDERKPNAKSTAARAERTAAKRKG